MSAVYAGLAIALCSWIALDPDTSGASRRCLVAAGAAAVLALAHPGLEVAVLAAAGVWLALRKRARPGGRREAVKFAAAALGRFGKFTHAATFDAGAAAPALDVWIRRAR